MHKIEKHIHDHWEGKLKGKSILVACSAGVDSTILLYVLKKLKFDVSAAHVNYHLRGEESNDDQNFIEQFSKAIGVKCSTYSIELSKHLSEGGNLQQLARDVRYSWLEKLAKKKQIEFIAFAHHQDDQVETFFINVARKSGVMGLAAMPAQRDQFIRPLLPFTKNELRDYAQKENVHWREDLSNSSLKYTRNRLRNEFIPFLKTSLPSLNESVDVLTKLFQQKQKELEQTIVPIFESIHETHQLLLKEWMNLDEFEKVEFCRQFSFPVSIVKEMDQLINSQKGKRIDLSYSAKFEAIIKEVDSFSFIHDHKSSIPQLKIVNVADLPKDFSKDTIYLDRSKVNGELAIREWEIGDRIKPIGMKGSTLISDIISDAKLSSLEKSKVLVVHDDTEIHWCVGLKIGRKSIAKNGSTQIIEVSVI